MADHRTAFSQQLILQWHTLIYNSRTITVGKLHACLAAEVTYLASEFDGWFCNIGIDLTGRILEAGFLANVAGLFCLVCWDSMSVGGLYLLYNRGGWGAGGRMGGCKRGMVRVGGTT